MLFVLFNKKKVFIIVMREHFVRDICNFAQLKISEL